MVGIESSPAEGRERLTQNLLYTKVVDFTYASKGFTVDGPKPAINVLTYIQKFVKRYDGHEDLERFYTILSNAAHRAVGAKLAYSSALAEHETGAYSRRLLSRRPPDAGYSTDMGFRFAFNAAKAMILFGSEGWRLLYQALDMADDFGLATRSGLLTLYPYWRKLVPGRRSRDTCPWRLR